MYDFAKWLLSEQRSELEILDKVENMMDLHQSITEPIPSLDSVKVVNTAPKYEKLDGRLIRKALRKAADSPVKDLIIKDVKYVEWMGNKVTCKFTTKFNLDKFIQLQISNEIEALLTKWTGNTVVCTCKHIRPMSKPIKVTAMSKWGIEKTFKSVAEASRFLKINSGNLWMYLFDNKNMPEATRNKITSLGWTFKTNE